MQKNKTNSDNKSSIIRISNKRDSKYPHFVKKVNKVVTLSIKGKFVLLTKPLKNKAVSNVAASVLFYLLGLKNIDFLY